MTEQEAIDYFNNFIIDTRIGLENICKTSDLINLSIKALEKQIPKVPILQDEDCLECPNCDSFIGYASECKDEHYRVEYCPNCGQALKWK